MEIDGPEQLELTFAPTSAWEANRIRAWGVEFCQDNGLDEVSFTYTTANQFKKRFRISAEGAMETDLDLDPRLEFTEVRRIHHA